jgi:hypothetical protein
MSFNNNEDLHTWYWSNITPEECDTPHDYFYLSLSAHVQAQFNHQMDNPELQYMTVCDGGLPKQECTQSVSNSPTPIPSRSQETKHHSNCIAPAINYHSSAETEHIAHNQYYFK